MVQPPAGGTQGIVQPATATLTLEKKDWTKTVGSGRAREEHAEKQVVMLAQPNIKDKLAEQDDTGTVAVTLDVDTQVCDGCCAWFDRNLISWLKRDAKVGSGKKARDWSGTFSLTINANGASKTISGKAATIAGLGGGNWAPVGEGY